MILFNISVCYMTSKYAYAWAFMWQYFSKIDKSFYPRYLEFILSLSCFCRSIGNQWLMWSITFDGSFLLIYNFTRTHLVHNRGEAWDWIGEEEYLTGLRREFVESSPKEPKKSKYIWIFANTFCRLWYD